MRENVIDLRTKEQKWEEFKQKASTKFHNGVRWVVDNKELVIVLAPVVIGSVTSVTKGVIRHANLHKAENVKNLYCYDRSLGHYWRLRRELSNKEWLEIDARKKCGERLADILDDMRVLK